MLDNPQKMADNFYMSDNNNIISDPSDIRMNNIRIRSHIRRI
jgi:hypothetical protein